MKTLSEQIAAAERFARTARFHLDNPRPENLDLVRRELLETLGANEVLLDEDAAPHPSCNDLPITNSAEIIDHLQQMVDVLTHRSDAA